MAALAWPPAAVPRTDLSAFPEKSRFGALAITVRPTVAVMIKAQSSDFGFPRI